MNKQGLLKILNPILFLSISLQIISSFILISPFDNESFRLFHTYNGYVIAILVVLHLILNWNWIKAQFFSKKK